MRLLTRLLAFVIALLPAPLVAQGGSTAQAASYDGRIGLVLVTEAGVPCLAIPNHALQPGTAVALVLSPVVGEPGSEQSFMAEIASANAAGCARDSTMEISAYGDTTYALTNVADHLPVNAIYFGVVAGASQVQERAGMVTASLGASVPTARFRVCTSNEGIHLTVWSGEPLKSQRLWHRYVHFDFETEPRCDAADYARTG